MFNTIHGNQNIWNIGGANAKNEELEFYNNLCKMIIE